MQTQSDLIPGPWPERFNLASYFLDERLDEGREGKVALRCGDELRTYGRLIDRSCQVAAALRRAGVRPEDRVLIALPDGIEFAKTFFGILRAGGVFAMVNPLLKREDLRYYLDYTKARVVVGHAEYLDELAPAFEAARHCKELWVVGGHSREYTSFEDALQAEDATGVAAEVEPTGPDDLAGWLFTSGSTGKPKACVHTQADFAFSTETYAKHVVGYGPDDVCLSVPKLFFGYATGTNLMFPLRFGGCAVLFPGRSTVDELLEQIAVHRPTLLTGVPTMFSNLLRSPRIEELDFGPLRATLSAGEALPAELYREWKERTGVEILDGIGSAEMFHIYITNRPGDVKAGSLGRLVEGYEAQIIDPEGQVLGDDEPGRLRVRGGSTAICYWGDRKKSIETFQGDWCTSADVFRRDAQGYFYYEGRSDDLIKVSGIWVSPLEIENALLTHDAVAEVCVVGREGDDELVKPLAYVVPVAGVSGDDELAAELVSHLKATLAPYKYPRWFCWREDLPRNDRGKIARRVLVDEARSFQP
ncbi:benzoate-CoA ligase family protein [Engelhardtia mirabilis]|uniref:Benzoate--CoA ligase n=1 Tax=Engelhardtia mirabilis TaxID=2528011 RepID=A0A518BHN3_9BACT|nr:Benzoate--CoA ligase [Planctomycetes bacterium Pla133]QDV00814.1 Benzoate--CoA ligase [Planctomycetes bacterium Pla86]